MSLTSAYSSSLGGLAAVSTWAEATASNIANVDRAGYARRQVLTATGFGGVAVTRIVADRDAAVERLHRIEVGRVERQEAVASLVGLYTARLGQPGDPGGVAQGLASLQTAVAQAAATPQSDSALSAVVDAASTLAATIADADAALDSVAATTETRVAQTVAETNVGLARMAELNARLADPALSDAQKVGLEDEAVGLLDDLAALSDVRSSRESGGAFTLFLSEGTVLVRGDAAERLAFDPGSARITTSQGGETVDVTPGREGARGAVEGRLAGEVHVLRDVIPRMSDELDSFAQGLVEALRSADDTLSVGQPGLLMGDGPEGDGRDGLAARIVVNPLVREGGEVWRVRDGFGAAAPGSVGDGARLLALGDGLASSHSFAAVGDLPVEATLGSYVAALVTSQQGVRVAAEDRVQTLSVGSSAMLAARQDRSGVDLNAELQALDRLQQSFRANSEVVRTLSDMLDTLLAAV